MKGLRTKIPPLIILGLLLMGQTLMAQFTASGKVVDEGGEPLIGVSISARGTALGTISDIDGNFSIEIPSSSATLEFTYVGYVTAHLDVVSGSGPVNVVMVAGSTQLDEVVVTGLASSVKRSNLAHAVSSISGQQLSGVTSVQTVDGALQGKLTGANIVANSGAPGGGISVKLRGITTINGSSEPLYIVDGIYMDNSAFSAGTNPVTQARTNGEITDEQDNPSNRIADLDPNDIESIEVLKGASAASIYGARANAGVIIITTKKGRQGPTRVNFNQSFGVASLLHKLGLRDYTEERVRDSWNDTEAQNFLAAQSAGKLVDYEEELYGNKGFLYNASLNLSGGTEKTQFFVSGSLKNEDGIIKRTGYDRKSIRVNLNHKISEVFDLQVNSYLVRSDADRSLTNNDNTGVSLGIALTSTPPWADLFPVNGVYPNNPYAASNPLQTRDLMTNNELTNRVLAGGLLNINLIRRDRTYLKVRLHGGVDNYVNETTVYFPENLQFQVGQQDGFYSRGNNVVSNYNTSAFIVWDNYLDKLALKTSAGISRVDLDQERLTTQATQLIGAQQNLEQAGSLAIFNKKVAITDIGYSVQQEANYDDKIIGTVGVRFDKSSLIGDPNKLFAYPKAAVAVNLANFDFMSSNTTFSQLKLRAAYGQAGGVPVPNSNDLALPAQTILTGITIDGNAGSLVGLTRGNSEIVPERSKELEVGVDLQVLDGRVGLEATYYNKVVTDLIIPANVATSQGFAVQVFNAGDLENKGVELALRLNPVRKQNFNWNANIFWWRNRSEMTRLDIPAFTKGSFASALGIFKIEEGKSVTQIVGPIPGSEGDVVIGDAEPDFQMSWYNEMTFMKNFDFTFLFHWKKGGDNIQLTSLLTDFGGTSFDYDDDDDGNGVPNGPQRIQALIGDTPDASQFVESSGYIKLREAALYYTLPESVTKGIYNGLQRVQFGISGNNLFLSSEYRSYDPEVSNFGNDGVSTGVEVTPYPSSRRIFFHLNIGF